MIDVEKCGLKLKCTGIETKCLVFFMLTMEMSIISLILYIGVEGIEKKYLKLNFNRLTMHILISVVQSLWDQFSIL